MAEAILRVIDFETNGIAPPDEVIELGICDVILRETQREIAPRAGSVLFHASPLKPEARAVHHITPAELEGRNTFSAGRVIEAANAEGVVAMVAHNWAFEGQWMTPDVMGKMHALCTYKAALRIWPEAPSHSNGALRYWLEDQGLITPDHALTQPPHRAGPDAYVTAHILLALLNLATGSDMIRWTKEPPLMPRCPIGKFRGMAWPEVETGFLQWMTNQASMEEDLKWNARRELQRRKDNA